MGKRQVKEVNGWLKVLAGATVSLMVYLVGTVLLAFLLVKGVLRAEVQNSLLGIFGCLSAACGGFAVCRGKEGRLAAMLQSAAFAVMLLGGSYLFWEGPVWGWHSVIFLLSVALGAAFPLVLCGGEKKGKRRHRW